MAHLLRLDIFCFYGILFLFFVKVCPYAYSVATEFRVAVGFSFEGDEK